MCVHGFVRQMSQSEILSSPQLRANLNVQKARALHSPRFAMPLAVPLHYLPRMLVLRTW